MTSRPRGVAWTVPTPLPTALGSTPEFAAWARDAGIEFEADDLRRLGLYLALLFDANTAMNLTAVRDPAAAWTRHIADSLTLLPLLSELEGGARVIDVGSGGGLPGVPLAICLPTVRFTLLEATGKKAEFLRALRGPLGLANVEVLGERAETAAHDRGERRADGRAPGHRGAYDAAVARAVGPLAVIAELTLPFVRVGGRVLLIKGEKAEGELAEAGKALTLLHAEHVGTIATPTGRVVVLEKTGPTPRTYPRRDGEPARSPLK